MKRFKKTMTLIELVMVIAVFAVAITPILLLMSSLNQQVVQARLMNSAIVLGRDILEEILSKRYDERTIPPYTSWSSHLGPDSGESRNNYDDVDDFDGLSEGSVSGYPGFSRRITVCYVDPDNKDLDTCRRDSQQTNYKRVDVTVHHNLLGDVRFAVIVSSEYPQ